MRNYKGEFWIKSEFFYCSILAYLAYLSNL